MMGRKVKAKGKKIRITPFSQLEIDKSKEPEITTLGGIDDVKVVHFKNKKGNPAASVIAITDKIDKKTILISDRNTAGIKAVNVIENFNEETGEKTYNLVSKTSSNKVISTTVSIKPMKKPKKKKKKENMNFV